MPTVLTFDWFPDASIEVSHDPKVTIAKFGDGYEQRMSLGLNADLQKWSLNFSGNRTRIDAIDQFLRARKGAESFTWVNPDSETIKVVCRSWKKKRERAALVSISCTFEQVPE